MKNKSILAVLCLTILMTSCLSTASIVPKETSLPTITPTTTTIPTTAHIPTYAYLPTITPIPSSTPFTITLNDPRSLTSQYSKTSYDNAVTVAIEEESFFEEDYHSPVYQVILNYKNSSNKEIKDVTYYLVTHKSRDYKIFPDIYKFTDFYVNVLGSNEERRVIPVGESKITIDLFVYIDGNYFQCKDGSLDEPLYLLLFFGPLGDTDDPLEVSNDLNRRILEIPCKYP